MSLLMFPTLLLLLAVSAAAVPQFTVDLDVDPEERWKDVIHYYKKMGAVEAMTRYDPSKHPYSYETQQIWLKAAERQLDEDFEGEIRGWIKYGGFNVTREGMLMSSVGYEMNYPNFCSGLLAAMPNGTVVHGRNMDYTLDLEINGKKVGWPDLTVDVTFMRGGKPFMTSVTWPGQLGIHTAMRYDGWTFEHNTRRLGDDFRLNTLAAQQGGKVHMLFVRRVMERVPDFETAVQELWSARLAAPQYWVMTGAGPYEAAVLTLDRLGVHESSSSPLRRLSPENNTWHLLQTNDDVTGPPHDYRRPVENMRLDKFVQSEVSPERVFAEMHSMGLKNSATVFTWIAIPATGFHKTILPNETWEVSEMSAEVSTPSLQQTYLPSRHALKFWRSRRAA